MNLFFLFVKLFVLLLLILLLLCEIEKLNFVNLFVTDVNKNKMSL